MRTLQQDGIDKVRMGIDRPTVRRCRRRSRGGNGFGADGCRLGARKVMEIDFADVLTQTVELNASDLHMTVGSPPMVRVRGELQRLDYPQLTSKDTRDLIYGDPLQRPAQAAREGLAGRLLLLGARRTAASGSTPTCSARRSAPPFRLIPSRSSRSSSSGCRRRPRVRQEAARLRARHRSRPARASRPRSRR